MNLVDMLPSEFSIMKVVTFCAYDACNGFENAGWCSSGAGGCALFAARHSIPGPPSLSLSPTLSHSLSLAGLLSLDVLFEGRPTGRVWRGDQTDARSCGIVSEICRKCWNITLSHTTCFQSRFAEVSSPTNSLLLLI